MMKKLQNLLVVLFCLVATIAFAQAPNDNCADAIMIGEVEDLDFSTLSANTDGLPHANDCVSSGTAPDSTFADIWYLYTSSITGQVEFTTCSTADFDTKIFVYNGTAACPPGDADIVGCSEDGPGCDLATSQAIFDVVAGDTYFLRLGGFGDAGVIESGMGTFSVREFVAIPGPENDFCVDATAITETQGQAFDNSNANTDGPDHPNNPCFGFGDITVMTDIWYTYTADFTGSIEWSTCNNAIFDTRMAVYNPGSACPPLDADLLACNDDGGGCAGFTSQLIFDVVMGETYLLRLGGFNGETGTGTMSLLNIIPPEPPANDLCSNATSGEAIIQTALEADNFDVLHEGTTIAGDFDNSTFRFPECLGNQNGGEFSDVWYTFNTLGNTELEFRLSATNADGASFYLDLWNACDSIVDIDSLTNTINCIELDGTMNSFATATFVNLPPVPTDYFIRIITRLTSQTPGDFWFQIVGDITVDIDELIVNEIKLFPNPTNSATNLQFNLQAAKEVSIEMTNLIGQQVYVNNTGLLNPGNQSIEIPTNHLQSGIYLVSMSIDGETETRKLIVE